MVCKNTEKNVQRICHVRRFTTCPASRKSAFTQPFFLSEMKTDRPKETHPVGDEMSATAATPVLHCGTWRYLCHQPFSRGINSLPTACSYFQWNLWQTASDLRDSGNTTASVVVTPHCVCCAEKNSLIHIHQTYTKTQIPVLSLISPQADAEHHVNSTQNTSETSQHGFVPQALSPLLHCPSTAVFQIRPMWQLTISFSLLARPEIS